MRSLGEFPAKTNLQKAIKKRNEYYEKFSNGVDPTIERKKKSANENIPTLEAFLEEYFKHKILKKSTETVQRNYFDSHLRKVIGTRKLDSFFAYISGLIKLNPLADTSGAIQKPRQKPHSCIIDGIYNKQERKLAIGKLLLDIHSFSGNWVNQMALILMANIFQRPSEICGLRWENIDFYEGLINLHASKTDTKIIIPTCKYVIKILKLIKKEYDSDWVFPLMNAKSRKGGVDLTKHTTKEGFIYILNKLGYENTHRPHAFRAMARSVLEEDLKFPTYLIK